MKVFSCPDEAKFEDPDYANYDIDKEQARQQEHKATLKTWLEANGWSGPRTGEILQEPMGDGYALYMYGDGPKPCLIHLPYGDSWDSPNVRHLPKKEVLARLDRHGKRNALFGA